MPDLSDRDDGSAPDPREGAAPTTGAAVGSFLDRVHHAVLARGEIAPLYRQYLGHARSLGALPEEALLRLMNRAMAAATLQLALLPPDQYCSWSFNLAAPRVNLFLAGDNSDFKLTGRIFTTDVKATDASRLYVEWQRPKHKVARSVVDFEGSDVLDALAQYYDRSLQMRVRMIELGPDDLVLVQGLPMVDEPWLVSLDAQRLLDLFEEGLEPIERRTYHFACGCNEQRIRLVVREIFRSDPGELFVGGDSAEVQCPRCGRKFVVSRKAFDAPEA